MSGAAWALEVRGLSAQGFELAGATCRGAARAVNEDRVRVCERGLCVIDGVGGLGTGEVFAELAANRVQRLLVRGKGPDWALREASCDLAELRRYVLREGGGAMGCACEIGQDGSCTLAALGDVRAFLVGEDGAEEVCGGALGASGYLGDGRGVPRTCLLAEKHLNSKVLLICSDGLWRFVTGRDLVDVVRDASSLEEAAERLVRLARSCASPDDVTVALCRPLAESPAGQGSMCPTV